MSARPIEVPMTPRQRLIWVEEELNKNSLPNMVTTLLEIRGDVNAVALAHAFDRLVDRHEALRMSLPGHLGGLLLRLPAREPSRLEFVDLAQNANARFDGWLAERLRLPVPQDGQLFDVCLVRRGPDDHVIFVNRHHIVSDNASSIVLHDELETLYLDALDAGDTKRQPSGLDPPQSYADYLRAEATRALAGDHRESEAFWSERSNSKPPALRFYGGSSTVSTLQTERTTITLDAETSRRIDRGRSAHAALMLLTTLFAFLHRVTGETDLAIGVPFHNRTNANRAMIGLIMDICPNRIQLEPRGTFGDLMGKVRREIAEVRPHRRYTISAAQAGYEVLFNFLPDVPSAFAGHAARYMHASPLVLLDNVGARAAADGRGREKLSVTVQRGRGSSGYEVHMDFNCSILPAGLPVDRVAGHFRMLLNAFMEDSGQPIDSVDVLTEDERARLFGGMHVGHDASAQSRTVVDMFRETVDTSPDREAVVSDSTVLTYRELDRQVRVLASALRDRGARSGSLVGVCVDRTPRMVVALLAVLRAGAAYVPIDPRNPVERIDLVLADVEPQLLISEPGLRARLGDHRQDRVICLDTLEPGALSAGLDAEPAPAPGDLAYIIYTSGSTGRPKGVPISHAQLAGFLIAMRDRIGMTRVDRALATTTIAFDPLAVEVFLPLVIGASVVVAPYAVTTDGRALARVIADRGITFVQGAPTMYRMLLSTGWNGSRGLTILCGAEAMSASLAKELLQRAAAVWNLYGPTETTVWATARQVSPAEDPVVSIGSPLNGVRVYVLNAVGMPTPLGVPGEIAIGGAGVANGYHNRPQQTRERFLPDPFDRPENGHTMFRTGDFGRFREDLNLEFIGRLDHQVKVRGFRVELEEVESVIRQYAGVADCCVTTWIDRSGETALKAHVEPTAASEGLDLAALKPFLRHRLPDYMVPGQIVTVERLPRSPTGKLDRAAIARMDQVAQPAESGAEPATKLEERVVAIWRDILDDKSIGVGDDFFDVGGHSLLAVNMVLEIERQLGIELSLAAVFETRTVRELCNSLNRIKERRPVVILPLVHGDRAGRLYFVHSMSSILALSEALPGSLSSSVVMTSGARQVRQLIGDANPRDAIGLISDAYAEAIRASQEPGPIYLVGHSFAGVLAVETACRLELFGMAPKGVFLLDTGVHPFLKRLWGKWLMRQAKHAFSGDGAAMAAAGISRMTKWFSRLRPREAEDRMREASEADVYVTLALEGMDAYRGPSSPLSSVVVLMKASDRNLAEGTWEVDERLGWGRYFGDNLSVVPVPGDHESLLDAENVAHLAAGMLPYLG